MLFTTVAAFLFPVAIMAAPPAVRLTTDDERCLPTTYIMTEYTLERSANNSSVSFNIESTYTHDSPREDPVDHSVNCKADGTVIGGNNECNFDGEKTRKMIFDSYQREDSDIPSYRITHTWACKNATWVSTSEIESPAVTCNEGSGKDSGTIICNAKPIIFIPQNTQKLSEDDPKKAKVAVKPTGKPEI